MSVGGIVVGTRVLDDRVWVATTEREYPNDEPTCIYVERTPASRTISEGDSLWWQGRWAFWTPSNRAFTDMRLRKIGFSQRLPEGR